METERFSVPELLFHPGDVGLQQMGVVECLADALCSLPPVQREAAAGLVVLTGGNTMFPGFTSRFQSELRPLLDEDYRLRVVRPEEPRHFAWSGAQRFVSDRERQGDRTGFVTRAQYLEHGHDRVNRLYDAAW